MIFNWDWKNSKFDFPKKQKGALITIVHVGLMLSLPKI